MFENKIKIQNNLTKIIKQNAKVKNKYHKLNCKNNPLFHY